VFFILWKIKIFGIRRPFNSTTPLEKEIKTDRNTVVKGQGQNSSLHPGND